MLTPTRALPGTRDKIEVMRKRASAGLPLFHPEDATFSSGMIRLLDEVIGSRSSRSSKIGKIELRNSRIKGY
jgi:hypothetical protein